MVPDAGHVAERVSAARIAGIKAGRMPETIDVQLATLAAKAPVGEEWLHEIKFDGYRMICRIDEGRVQLTSRSHNVWTDRFRPLAEAARKWPLRQAILDGEVVALRSDGISDFERLQTVFRDRRESSLLYYAFDILC